MLFWEKGTGSSLVSGEREVFFRLERLGGCMCKVRLGVVSKADLVGGRVCDHWDKLCVVSVDTPHSSFICSQLGS